DELAGYCVRHSDAEPPGERRALVLVQENDRPFESERSHELVEQWLERLSRVASRRRGAHLTLEGLRHTRSFCPLGALRRTRPTRRVHRSRSGPEGSPLGRHESEGVGVSEVRVDRGHDDSCLDSNEVDADERDPDPGIDDDALVENPVEDIDEARATWRTFNWHRFTYLLSVIAPARARARRCASPGGQSPSDPRRCVV